MEGFGDRCSLPAVGAVPLNYAPLFTKPKGLSMISGAMRVLKSHLLLILNRFNGKIGIQQQRPPKFNPIPPQITGKRKTLKRCQKLLGSNSIHFDPRWSDLNFRKYLFGSSFFTTRHSCQFRRDTF